MLFERSRHPRFKSTRWNRIDRQASRDGQETQIGEEERRNNLTEANRRGIFATKQGRPLLKLLALDPNDAFAHFRLKKLLQAYKDKEPFTAPFYERLMNEGEILVGEDPWNGTPHYQLIDDVTSTFICGTPGCGKTTFLKMIAPQFAMHGKTLIIDAEKEELQDLTTSYELLGQSLHVFDGATFPYNPMDPEGLNWRVYLEYLAIAFGSSSGLLDPSIRFFKGGGYRTFQRCFESGQEANPPTLVDIFEDLERQPANQYVKDAVLPRLTSMIMMTPGFNYYKGEKTDEITKNNIVLQYSGMDKAAQEFLLGAMIYKAFLQRKKSGAKNHWAIFIDDAQRPCSNENGPLASLINVIRATSISFHIFVQSSKGIAPSILDNCSTKFCGTMASADELHHASRSMGLLTREQVQWMSTCQQKFQWVTQLSHGWRKPFVLQAPPNLLFEHLQIPPRQANQTRIGCATNINSSANRSVFGTELVEAVEYRNWAPSDWQITKESSSADKSDKNGLSAKQLELLEAISERPGRPSSTYSQYTSFSQKAAIQIRRQLLDLGLIKEEHVKTKKLGRTAKLLEVTDLGLEALQREFNNKA